MRDAFRERMDKITRAPVYTRLPVMGRSLHRAFVAVPIVLMIATLGFFVVFARNHEAGALRTALHANIATVAAAALAAIAGLAELRAIPTEHPVLKIAVGHMILNTIILVLFIANLIVYGPYIGRGNDWDATGVPSITALVLTTIAVGLTLLSGALGYWMVHDYRIGEARPTLRPPTDRPSSIRP
jgi:uncharacterized membrane protein